MEMALYPYITLVVFYQRVSKLGLGYVWFRLFIVWLDVGVYSKYFWHLSKCDFVNPLHGSVICKFDTLTGLKYTRLYVFGLPFAMKWIWVFK